jgi:hypothetical protein
MQIIEVKGKQERMEFLDFPRWLYRDDPFWVSPLDSELEAIFDPAKNHSFSHGEAARWILKDGSGKTIGRVAAFLDNVRSAANRQPTGGMGFFEVIDDRDAAFRLFDTASEWLKSRKAEAMDGPINFGENDSYWGLLVDGFAQQGFGMPYNMKYYRKFFEDYGFRNYFEQYSYHREVRTPAGEMTTFPPRIMKVAEWIANRPGYSFRHFTFRDRKKFINDIADIYNSTWSAFKEDFTPLNPGILEESFQKAKALIDEELIWFAYLHERPVAFFILYPDLNQIIRYFKGKLGPVNMLRFAWFKATHKITRARAVVGGVTPSCQNSGIESAIFYHIYETFRHKPWYTELELSWVGDFNPRMLAVYGNLGAHIAKTHITFRYLINNKLEFIRYKDEMEMAKKVRKEAGKEAK